MIEHINSDGSGKTNTLLASNRASHSRPMPGPQTQGRARFLDDVTTRQKVEWPSGSNITELTFFVSPAAGTTVANDEYAIVAIDAANDTIANILLTQTGSSTDDAGWIPIPIHTVVRIPLKKALSNGTLGGGRIDVVGIGGIALDVWIGAN